MESILACPICNGMHFTKFLDCTDFTTSQEKFTLEQCQTCTFVFTNPRPDKTEIGKYYQSDKYISHSGGRRDLIDQLYLLARKKTIRSKSQIIQQHSEGRTVLDIGCGTGEFLKELANKGYETFGIEPSLAPREKAIRLGAGKIINNISNLSEQTFDVITLWHVLEHIHDLNDSLRQIRQHLKNSGTIFIAVPNLKSQDAQHYKSHWAAYDVPRHLWHFSQDNMKTILLNHDLNIIATLPMRLDAYYVSLLSESYKNPQGIKLLKYFKGFSTALKSNMAARRHLNYSSRIYIARK
jgi:2-polyprenyl-3-methyl-5-hydroxy-6-metoxy-1,4-benzoquinol methylase